VIANINLNLTMWVEVAFGIAGDFGINVPSPYFAAMSPYRDLGENPNAQQASATLPICRA
jgi:hypothetical protein